MTIPQFKMNDGRAHIPTAQDHVDQGRRVLAAALDLLDAGMRVFPVHGLRWVRQVVPVGAATAVPGGDALGGWSGGEEDKEQELEVRASIELVCTCGLVACANPAKHPVARLVPRGFLDATTDPEVVRQWFAVPEVGEAGGPGGAGAGAGAGWSGVAGLGGSGSHVGWVPFNLAVATGQGLVVVDAEARQLRPDLPTGLDVLDNWEMWTKGTSLPPAVGSKPLAAAAGELGEASAEIARDGVYWPGTVRVRTGSGGVHVWVRVSPGLLVRGGNRVLPAVDVKADGGYVLVPPSRHVSGGVYELLEGDWKRIGDAAEPLVGWLLSVKGGRYATRRALDTTSGEEPEGYDFKRVLAGGGCPSGFRDYFVNDLCFRLRRAGKTLDEASAALRLEWYRMEQPAEAYFDWSTCVYKLRRVWEEVQPEDVTELPAWRPPVRDAATEGMRSSGLVATAADVNPVTGTANNENSHDGNDGVAIVVTESQTSPSAAVREGSTWRELERRDLTLLLTDTGNAMRFAQRMRDQVRFSPELDRWFVWDGTRWAPDVLGQAMLLTKEIIKDLYAESAGVGLSEAEQLQVYRWADTSQSVSRRQGMLTLAQFEPGIGVKTDDLDADPMQLVVLNGTLDLRPGAETVLRESLAADMNTMCAGVAYDPHARCPGWERHVQFVTGGDEDLARYLQRAVGYTLTGKTKEQKLFFLHGNGDNGKNVFMDVIAALLGDYAMSADENFLSGGSEHPTQLAALQGKRLVYADETDESRKVRESRIKHLTGSKTVRARFMRQNYFEFTPRFKLWIMGNHKMSITGNDDGIWRRIELVPFMQKIREEDKVQDFDQILIQDELPGILNWALEGLKMWGGTGLHQAKVVKKATQIYREDEDEEAQFFLDRVVRCPEESGGVMVFGAVYQEYRLWCAMTGTQERSKKAFAQELERRGFQRPDTVRRVPGYPTPQRVWLGGRLRTSQDVDF